MITSRVQHQARAKLEVNPVTNEHSDDACVTKNAGLAALLIGSEGRRGSVSWSGGELMRSGQEKSIRYLTMRLCAGKVKVEGAELGS